MKVIIEHTEETGWNVIHGDKVADRLSYDEMLGLVVAITIPDKRPCLQWLKTKEQHEAYEKYLEEIREKNTEALK
ncbi:MAG TPA: hypothetical protein PLI89_11770 [Chitinophagales bacterium]|nr:hypothetical protein [Chitinophagales bacterium]HAE34632.1 hypothetical protein [Bacteroidota bacterium]HQU40538.1 hypothetical protein [Chitinophagales bacterium]HQU77036.1 hypothetical protein [Chitinophagales bacterium]